MYFIGMILLTVAAIQYGFVPPIVDLTETHVFHQEWPPHARFHMMWLLTAGSMARWLWTTENSRKLTQTPSPPVSKIGGNAYKVAQRSNPL